MSVRNLLVSRLVSAATLIALLAACGDSADTVDTAAAGTAASSSQTADLANISNYELRMEQVDKYFAAFRNIAAAMQRMTPQQREQLDMDAGQTDLNGYVARLESQPEVNRAIRDAGLSAREFSLILWSMLQSGMASAVLQSRPELNEDSLARELQVNMANVRFIRENEAVLREKQQALDADMRAMGMDEDSDTL